MTKKPVANVVHHTHWDNEWYFTEQDSLIQFIFHMDELMDAFEKKQINKFYLDGQTAILDDYLKAVPSSKERIRELIKNEQLAIGPFHTQPDCFISSGESIINNLEIGMDTAEQYGGVSKVAYLPDSFGHSQDFPKIFNGLGIQDFVFRRGFGDKHQLPLDFYWKSNDGSKLLTNVEVFGYGFATETFMDGTINAELETDYHGLDIHDSIHYLMDNSRIPNQFLLPIGEDQTPVLRDFKKRLDEYNQQDGLYEFEETSLEEYMEKVRELGEDIPEYEGELIDTQYNRVHKSIFSARADIKALQDKIERLMTYEVQPLMTMLDKVGFPYKKEIVQMIWDLLVRSQTHSSATNTDQTNELIYERTKRSFNLAHGLKIYLVRKVAISVGEKESTLALSQNVSQDAHEKRTPLVLFNTLPQERTQVLNLRIFTKSKDFQVFNQEKEITYAVISREKHYAGVIRKDTTLMDKKNYYYETRISLSQTTPGLSYRTLYVIDGEAGKVMGAQKNSHKIENEHYQITFDQGIHLLNKETGKEIRQGIYLENSGDEGDNYDYSYPDHDWILKDTFSDAKVIDSHIDDNIGRITIRSEMFIPKDLESRENKVKDEKLTIDLTLQLKKDSSVIECSGTVHNQAKNHRVRLVFATEIASAVAYAGTQFGVVERNTEDADIQTWKERGWAEEPALTNALLNYIYLKDEENLINVYTRGAKEYEIIGEKRDEIAVTLFRSVGHFGLPDLNRRPGRASGLLNKIIESPDSQMFGENFFELGLSIKASTFEGEIAGNYVLYATDPVYYQNQLLERVIYPISYFGTNPLTFKIPETFELFELENSEAVFSTLKKNDTTSYLLRVYNNQNKDVEGGSLKIHFDYKEIQITNILGEKVHDGSLKLGKLKPGEIRNIKIIF